MKDQPAEVEHNTVFKEPIELEDIDIDEFMPTFKNISRIRFNKDDVRSILICLWYVLMFNGGLAIVAYLAMMLINNEVGAAVITSQPR